MPPPIPDLPPDERRAFVRFPCTIESPHHVIESVTECGWWATIVDASLCGISLRLPERIELGTLLILQPPAGYKWPRHALPALVVRAEAAPDGGWLLGCEFVYRLGDQDLEALLQRSDPRTAGSPQPVRYLSFGLPAGSEN